MAMTWDVTKVKDYAINWPDAGTPEQPEWNTITMAIVWHGLLCGFREITEANYIEVFARIKAYEDAFGASCSTMGEKQAIPRPITLDDIRKHIGFSGNASAKTLPTFKKFLGDTLYTEALRDAQRETEKDKCGTAGCIAKYVEVLKA